MINKIRNLYKKIYLRRLIKRGLSVGNDFQMEKGCNIDANFPWLIKIGNNVTMASWVYLSAHDGAAQKQIGYSRVGKIEIGDNVFIGARTIVLPNVTIGNNSVIGANSVVSKDIPDDVVAVGSPAKVIMDLNSYKKKLIKEKGELPVFEKEYTLWGGVTEQKKKEMIEKLSNQGGFIV